MTRAEIRYVAHQMLAAVEWLDKHATSRQLRDRQQLEEKLVDLEKGCLKIIDTPLRESDLNSVDADEPPEQSILER